MSLIKTAGQHGSDGALAAMPEILGDVCGIVLKHVDVKTLYIAGDTVWNEHVRSSLEANAPDVVVLNAGDAQVAGLGSIIMNIADVQKVYEAAPSATLIASHLEAVNHAVLTRAELRDFSARNGMTVRLLVPDGNEVYVL